MRLVLEPDPDLDHQIYLLFQPKLQNIGHYGGKFTKFSMYHKTGKRNKTKTKCSFLIIFL
jgi:hypothetical protein